MRVYQSINFPLFLAALVVYGLQTIIFLKQKTGFYVWVVETILLAGFLSRIILISLIHTTSFEAIWPSYLSPAYPLMLAFICLVLFWGFNDVLLWRARESSRKQTVVDP
jgi:hypothetical protein